MKNLFLFPLSSLFLTLFFVGCRDDKIDRYEYVDLGLSVKWATCNVGADCPEEYGDFYAWGEISPSNENASWSAYKFCTYSNPNDLKDVKLSKYNTDKSYGDVDDKTMLDLEDDVAHVRWGGKWRMPSKAELDELRKKCTWTITLQKGVKGFKVTSNVPGYTDCSIFLPGYEFQDDENFFAFLWSNTLDVSCPIDASQLNAFSPSSHYVGVLPRFIQSSVRPVFTSESWLDKVSMRLSNESKTVFLGNTFVLTAIIIDGEEEVSRNVTWESDNPSVATVDKSGVVTAISAGSAHITASFETISASCTVTVANESVFIHPCVDLGLSVKWATFNVGAVAPEDIGVMYAWGETNTKDVYNWRSYKFNSSERLLDVWLSKYNTDKSFGDVDDKTMLDLEDDVAHVRWGGEWHMPTRDDYEELINNCTWTWESLNGVYGCKGTSNIPGFTDRSVFFPAVTEPEEQHSAFYWSNTLFRHCFNAIGLYLNDQLWCDDHPCHDPMISSESRCGQYFIRPVI